MSKAKLTSLLFLGIIGRIAETLTDQWTFLKINRSEYQCVSISWYKYEYL